MAATGLRVDTTAVRQDGEVLLGMALRRSNEGDATVLVVFVVPAHEGPHPVSRGRECFERTSRERGAVLQGAKQGFGGLSSLTWGRLKDGTMPSHCRVARSGLIIIASSRLPCTDSPGLLTPHTHATLGLSRRSA